MHIQCNSPTYSVSAHDETLQQWEVAQHTQGPLTLDLSRVSFIDPYGMCALVLFLNHLQQDALPVRLMLPDWPSTKRKPTPLDGPASYLTRMNFFQHIADLLDLDLDKVPKPPAHTRDRNVLLEISILQSHEAISVSLHKTGEILQNLSYTVSARGHILEVLSELCSNVLLHAQTEFGCVAAMQTYRGREGNRYVVISIGDAGIGVRRSLAANQSLAARLHSDAQALGVAVQPGASRYGTGGHGGGLPRVMEIARRYNGQVAFRSGTGALLYRASHDSRKQFDAPPLGGTQLRIALPEASMRQAGEPGTRPPASGVLPS